MSDIVAGGMIASDGAGHHDCLIAGGRVAGAATAILMAGHGYRVLLADREPRLGPTLSTHVFGDWEAFAPLGVADALARAGAPPMTRFRTDLAGCVTEADMVVTPFVLGLRRERLDALLVARARELPGVTWAPGTTVTGLRRDRGGRVTGAMVRARGDSVARPVSARVVVGADGRDSVVAAEGRADVTLSAPAVRCAYYTYFRGMTPATLPTFEYYWADRDLVLVLACDDGLHCVCVMPPEEDFARWRVDRERLFAERLAGIATLAPRMRGAAQAGRVRGTRRLESYLRRPYGPGWALVGDAGAAVHPCVGAGIDHAVACAGILAAALHDHLAGRSSWDEAMARYHRARDARVRPTLEAALRLARRPAVPGEDLGLLRLLLTLPGMTHDLGTRASDVVDAIGGADAAARLRALLEASAPPAGASPPFASSPERDRTDARDPSPPSPPPGPPSETAPPAGRDVRPVA